MLDTVCPVSSTVSGRLHAPFQFYRPAAVLTTPPKHGDERSDGVGEHVERIAGAAMEQATANDFNEDRPACQMGENLDHGGRAIVLAKAERTMHGEQDRQRTRDEQQIVEPIVEKSARYLRLDQEAVHGVERAAAEKQRVAQAGEVFR